MLKILYLITISLEYPIYKKTQLFMIVNQIIRFQKISLKFGFMNISHLGISRIIIFHLF